ncbi:hypothetical protein WJ970_02485 [Achromobacter xylosoxidans]
MSSSSRNPHATQASRTPLLARLPAIQTLSYQRRGREARRCWWMPARKC